ncbi:MAG: cyclic nucleotide-binding domain-containing protein [Acidobacteria bacterium]|nr:cyclic nucleotide-binding domain-containing protein [Acidobacteriota bacterium]
MTRTDQPVDPGRNPHTAAFPRYDPVPIERLKTYPFLDRVTERILEKLQPNLIERDYAPGDVILRVGEYSDAAYFIVDGLVEVRVSTVADERRAPRPTATPPRAESHGLAARLRHIFARTPVEGAVQLIGTSTGTLILDDMPVDVPPGGRVLLETGEVFGEHSALSRYPFSAEVTARAPTRCLMIRTPALLMLMKQGALADFKLMIDERYRMRSLSTHLRNVELFADLDESILAGLQRSAELKSFEPGALIVEQGSAGDAFYLVRGGYVKVAVGAGSSNLAITYLRKGDYAGELSLLMDEPWPFSLFALEHVEMVKIARADFDQVIDGHDVVRDLLWQSVVTRLKERGAALRNPLSAQYLQMAMDSGLIHGESVLLIDLNTCTRCDDCVRACSDTHGGRPRFIREGTRFRQWSIPTACYQCTDPVCMIGCPTGAITRPIGSLEVTINKDTCIGCHNCVKRCPWNNIIEVAYSSPTINRDIELATKCDLCLGRTQGPACVQMCPHGSATRISFKDLETVTTTLSAEAMR